MSKFMPKSVAGHFDAPAGATMKTQPYNQLPALPDFIGQMDAQNHTAFTSINEATAYFQHLKKSILNLNQADFLAHVGADYYEHIVRYIIISGLILMSEMRDDIECKVSYIRIADDDLSPYKPDLIFPLASKYFNELLNEWAEFIDPNLEASDSTPATKIRMLCVVLLNDVPVAYYSPDSIMFYSFKTITSSPDKVQNLPGVGINPNNNEWVFSLPDFQASCQAVGYLTINQRQILASKLNNLNSLPNTGNGFSLIRDILNLHFVGVVAPTYVDVPVKMSVYTIPGTHPVSRSIESQEMPLLNNLGHLLAVPMENQKAAAIQYTPGNLARDIYHALGFSIPKCTIFNDANTNQQWLMVSEVQNCSFSYCGIPVTTAGLLITPPLGVPLGAPPIVPLNLDVTYESNNNQYHLGTISFSCNVTTKKVAFDIPNQKLSFFVGGNGGMLNPFVLKYWKGVDNLLPVTKEFIHVIKDCGYQLGKPSILALANGTDIQIEIPIEDTAGTAVDIIKHTYSEDSIIDDANLLDIGAGQTAHPIMPQLSVYPYQIFKDNAVAGTSVWNNYYFSALIDDPQLYKYFKTLNFTYDSPAGATTLDINQHEKVMLSAAGDYTGYRTIAPVIPNYIFITDNQGVELGTIYIPNPPVTIVDPAKEAAVGIDMGSRNSIMATYNKFNGDINYTYSTCIHNGKPLNYIFCKYTPLSVAEFDEACNMFGSPTTHATNCDNSFISSVLDYINIPGNKYEPYKHGRLIADLEDATYQKILDMAKNLGAMTIHPMDDIGLHNGFKEKLYRLTMGMPLPPEVELFIKNACYQMVLNAFCEGCGNISLNFTAPDDATGTILQAKWQDAINNQKILFGIPATINITAAPYMLEAAAIFYNIVQIGGMAGVHQYAITIDAGDSTFDVSVFSCDKKAVTHNLNKTFSIKYAGKRLIVESIIDVCKANKVTSNVFCNLWGTMGMMHGQHALPTPKPFVDTITDANNDIDWDKDSTKDVIYKLIENFGLNIFIATPLEKPIMEEIRNFINLKYCLMLNAILETCVSILPSDDIVDPTITVAFYGGTNNVANLLYNSPTNDLKNLMDSWLPTYANNAGITGTDVRFNVNGAQSGKQDLVKGLVKATPAPMTPKLIHVADDANYSHDIYFNTISQIFPKPTDGQTSPYWELDAAGNYTCILDIPQAIISNIPAVAANSFANIENDVKKSFLLPVGAPPLNLPRELIYPLYTFFLAIEKFKNINSI